MQDVFSRGCENTLGLAGSLLFVLNSNWIAGLSLVNSVMALSASSFGFALGLGIIQIFNALASSASGSGKGIAFGLDLLASGVFVFFDVLANKAYTWTFVVGMVLFAMDGLLALIGQA